MTNQSTLVTRRLAFPALLVALNIGCWMLFTSHHHHQAVVPPPPPPDTESEKVHVQIGQNWYNIPLAHCDNPTWLKSPERTPDYPVNFRYSGPDFIFGLPKSGGVAFGINPTQQIRQQSDEERHQFEPILGERVSADLFKVTTLANPDDPVPHYQGKTSWGSVYISKLGKDTDALSPVYTIQFSYQDLGVTVFVYGDIDRWKEYADAVHNLLIKWSA